MIEQVLTLLRNNSGLIPPILVLATGLSAALYAYRHRSELWVREYLGKVVVTSYLIAMAVVAAYYVVVAHPSIAAQYLPGLGATLAVTLPHLLHILGAYVVARISLAAAHYLPKAGAAREDAPSAKALRASPYVLTPAMVAGYLLVLRYSANDVDPKFDTSLWAHAYRLLVALPCLFFLGLSVWLLIAACRRTKPEDRVARKRYGWFAVAESAFFLLWINFLLWPLAVDVLPFVGVADVASVSRVSEIPILIVMGAAHMRAMTLPPDQGTPEALLEEHARFDHLNDAIGAAARRYDVRPPIAVPHWKVCQLVLRKCLEDLLFLRPREADFRIRLARRTMSLLALVSPEEDPEGIWREDVVELARLRDSLPKNDPDDAMLQSLDAVIELTDEAAVRPLAHDRPWLQAAALAAANEDLLPEAWATPLTERRLLRPLVHDAYDRAASAAARPTRRP